MREIKFRGKRIDNGEWVYGDLVSHYENQRRYIACDELAYTYTECGINRLVTERAHEVYPETVGQYTGMNDKKGKEIYEGDIVKLCDTNPVLFKVEIILGKFGYRSVFRHLDDNSIAEGYFLDKCEVIGNIYKSELLEVSHE